MLLDAAIDIGANKGTKKTAMVAHTRKSYKASSLKWPEHMKRMCKIEFPIGIEEARKDPGKDKEAQKTRYKDILTLILTKYFFLFTKMLEDNKSYEEGNNIHQGIPSHRKEGKNLWLYEGWIIYIQIQHRLSVIILSSVFNHSEFALYRVCNFNYYILMQIRKTLTALILSVTISLSLYASADKEFFTTTAKANGGMNIYNSGISSSLIGLNSLYQYLNTYFLYDIDIEKVNEALTAGLLSALDDPYSEYIPKDFAEDFEENIDGTYVGIGTYLTKYKLEARDFSDPNTYMVQIVSPFPDSPAARAGIRSRDLISHINKESTTDMTATEASKMIRGHEGEPVVLTIHRGNAVFDVTIVREKITKPSVDSTIIEGTDIGYLIIADFNQSSYSLVTTELDKLKSNGMKHLIIDLRNNGGGTVDTALLIADVFLEGGKTIVTTKFKEGSRRQDITTQASPAGTKYLDLDIAILTNGGTASASEILTAALRDNGKAITIGAKTFGKGVMQDVFKWNEGFVKFTSASYLTPNGANINKVGILPDIEIKDPEYTDEETVAFYDFLKTSLEKEKAFIKQHPEFKAENLELFAKENAESKVPETLLKILIRNAYLNEMDYEDRPKIDRMNDDVLNEAIKYFEEK